MKIPGILRGRWLFVLFGLVMGASSLAMLRSSTP